MEYKQVETLKKYIEQLQADAFEEGVKVATKALSTQMSAIEKGQIRQGEWIDTESKGLRRLYKCSLCGGTCYFPNAVSPKPKGRFKFCPYCGAKMDEEVKDE